MKNLYSLIKSCRKVEKGGIHDQFKRRNKTLCLSFWSYKHVLHYKNVAVMGMYSVITSYLGDLYNHGSQIHYLPIKSSIIIFTLCIIHVYKCIFLRNFISNIYFTILLLKSKNRIIYYRFGTTVSLFLHFPTVYISCCVIYKLAFCNKIQALQVQ
jgi:hypothetical protein